MDGDESGIVKLVSASAVCRNVVFECLGAVDWPRRHILCVHLHPPRRGAEYFGIFANIEYI